MDIIFERATTATDYRSNFSSIISNNGGILEDILSLYKKKSLDKKNLILVISDNETLVPTMDDTHTSLKNFGGYLRTSAISMETNIEHDVIFMNIDNEYKKHFIEYLLYALGELLSSQYSRFILKSDDIDNYDKILIGGSSVYMALKLAYEADYDNTESMVDSWDYICDIFEHIVTSKVPPKNYKLKLTQSMSALATKKIKFGLNSEYNDKLRIALFNAIFGLSVNTASILEKVYNKEELTQNEKMNWTIQFSQIDNLFSSFETSEVI